MKRLATLLLLAALATQILLPVARAVNNHAVNTLRADGVLPPPPFPPEPCPPPMVG